MTSILTRNSSHTDILIFLRGLSAPCLSNLAISRCQLCVGLASSVHTFEKCPNELPFFLCKVCRSLLFLFFLFVNPIPSGFLFFGTIAYVEETIRNLLKGSSWEHRPIQYLVLYLSLVAGVCGSVRAHAPAVFCEEGYTGLLVVTEDSPIGKAL